MILFRISALVFFVFVAMSHSAAIKTEKTRPQDIEGGARRIFGERPANPTIVQTTKSNDRRSAASTKMIETNEGFEDALALGNSARDDHPPRYSDAEKAYRLAAKLKPSDPRSYMGMGNVMYDQHKYVEAAKMYRQALALLAAGNSARRNQVERRVGLNVDEVARIQASNHGHLGTCLLMAERIREAETEFLEAIRNDSKDARWYALLGYTYFLQKRFDEAASEIRTAIRLDPNKSTYREMLKSVPQ